MYVCVYVCVCVCVCVCVRLTGEVDFVDGAPDGVCVFVWVCVCVCRRCCSRCSSVLCSAGTVEALCGSAVAVSGVGAGVTAACRWYQRCM